MIKFLYLCKIKSLHIKNSINKIKSIEMKKLFFVAITVCLCCFILNSCKSDPDPYEYPITLRENTYIGTIVWKGNPCTTTPCLPGIIFWLDTDSADYVLFVNSHWINADKITVDSIEYFVDDEVQITGTVKICQDVNLKEYSNLEIETINLLKREK
jgi:hypothetical protein